MTGSPGGAMFAVLLIYVLVRYASTLAPRLAQVFALAGLVLTVLYCVFDYERFLLR